MRTEPNPYKGMTSPSTQNLNALSLWVLFLICCSTFSFLANMGLSESMDEDRILDRVMIFLNQNFLIPLAGL